MSQKHNTNGLGITAAVRCIFFFIFCVCEKVNDDLGGQLTAQSYIAACALAVAKPVAVANSTLV